jgi:hypothetical protein
MPNRETDPAEPAPAAGLQDEPPDSRQLACYEVSRTSLVYRYILLLALTIVGILLLYLLVPMAVADRDYLVGALLAVWALALVRYWYFLISMPYRICAEGKERLVLHSLFRKRKILLSEIAAVRVSPFYQSYLRIVTSRKKTIPLLNHVDGLHDLIARIRRVNPDLKTKGC